MSSLLERYRERFSPAEQVWLPLIIGVSLVFVAKAELDLQRRPADQVRGRKLPWRLVCLNALGAVSYLRWGRRAPPDAIAT